MKQVSPGCESLDDAPMSARRCRNSKNRCRSFKFLLTSEGNYQPSPESSFRLPMPISPPKSSVEVPQFAALSEIDQQLYFDLSSSSTFLDFRSPLPSPTIDPDKSKSSGPVCLCNPSNLRIAEEACSFQFGSLSAAAPTLPQSLSSFRRAMMTYKSYLTCKKCRNCWIRRDLGQNALIE